MSTVVDGRGNIKTFEQKDKFNEYIENNEYIQCNEKTFNKTFIPMSIEEYRELKFTPEQEWNNTYNPKKISIEALEIIEINKRGKGPLKNIYTPDKLTEEGPFYDPLCCHVHIWKQRHLIKNFIGQQFQNVPYIQYTNNKPGLYCSICHTRNLQHKFHWGESIDKCFSQEFHEYKQQNCNKTPKYCSTIQYTRKSDTSDVSNISRNDIRSEKNIIMWKKLMNKVNYSLYNKKIIYNISRFKSLYLWPWELTPYQKFKLNNKNYKDNPVFIKSEMDKFKTNYYTIA